MSQPLTSWQMELSHRLRAARRERVRMCTCIYLSVCDWSEVHVRAQYACPSRAGAWGSKCHVPAGCSETTLWVGSVCVCETEREGTGGDVRGHVGRHLTPSNQFTWVRWIWVFIRRGETSPLLAAFTCSMNKLQLRHGRNSRQQNTSLHYYCYYDHTAVEFSLVGTLINFHFPS